MTGADHLATLQQRAAYLALRAAAKRQLGWHYDYDERERAALEWAIARLGSVHHVESDDGA
jgi:hypothetical protein